MDISKLIDGNKEFKEIHFIDYQQKYKNLVQNGQNPTALFITCSDARVMPELITRCDPGELFILRNIGNMVPPFKPDYDFHATAAVIEYAVSVLNVHNIIVCGHSHCGACEALYRTFEDDELIHVRKWLELGHKARDFVKATIDPIKNREKAMEMTERVSLAFQVENLMTYPAVRRRVKEKNLKIHAWYYTLETGEIESYNCQTKQFSSLNGINCQTESRD